MAGWIKIYRDVQNHWIWKSDHRFKWWIDILLNVNHCDTKILIRGKLIECKRGQSIMSLETWGKRWNVTKKTVKDFFELLQSDSMLVYENIQITTRITVCNYDKYQSEVNGQETESKQTVNGQYTVTAPKQELKELKELKNDKKEEQPNKSVDFIGSLILAFKKAYEEINQLPYVVTNEGKERSAAGKILKIYRDKYPDADSDEMLNSLSKYFLDCVSINDDWLRKNMSLPIIINKFNEINNIIKHGTNKGTGVTDKQLAELVAKKIGIVK